MIDMSVLVNELNQHFQDQLNLSEDGLAIIASKKDIKALLEELKDKYAYKFLVDITAVDLQGTYEVVYHVMRLSDAEMLRLKVVIPGENTTLSTITDMWQAANVMEREIFDLMGIIFTGHPNLKRVLCSDDFKGHPLRKDFKLNIPSRF